MRKFIGIERLDILDDRWYEVTHEVDKKEVKQMFASVTHKLGVMPINEGLKMYFKTTGFNGDLFFKLQAEFGSAAHSLVQAVLTKHPVKLLDHPPRVEVYDIGMKPEEIKAVDGLPLDNVAPSVKPTELWERYGYWTNFWHDLTQKYEVEIVDVEYMVFDTTLKTAGTVDFHMRIKRKPEKDEKAVDLWKNIVVDWKFGNSIQESHKIQIATYATMTSGLIDEAWLVHIPRKKLNDDGYSVSVIKDEPEYWKSGAKKGKQKGKTITQLFEEFKLYNKVWNIKNPNAKPKNKSMEVVSSLEMISKKPLFIEEKADAKPTR